MEHGKGSCESAELPLSLNHTGREQARVIARAQALFRRSAGANEHPGMDLDIAEGGHRILVHSTHLARLRHTTVAASITWQAAIVSKTPPLQFSRH